MIVVAGGTGRLGRILVKRLGARGELVRVLSRAPERARATEGRVDVVAGDVRDRDAVDRAVAGARVVISAMSAFGMRNVAPREVDFGGNVSLIAAAEKHGVERFVLVSVLGACAEHPMELARMKYFAEQRLIESKVSWSILRPSTFTETFQEALCAPLLKSGKAIVLGRAQNPINFVSAHDVAHFVELATTDPGLQGSITDIGGTENLTLTQFVDAFGSALGLTGPVRRIPRLAMRVLSQLARPFNPTFARLVQAGVLMDTRDMSFDASQLMTRYPHFSPTGVAAVARRDYASALSTRTVTT